MKAWMLAAGTALLCTVGTAQAATVWVTSEKDNAITLIDEAKMAVVGRVATCKRPRHIQLLPGSQQLLVACGDSHQGDVIDIATRKSLRRMPLGDDPEAFDLSPDGKQLYVSAEEEGQLLVLDAASGKPIKAVKVGEEPEGVLTGKGVVYVTSEVANMVHVVDPAAGKSIKNVTVGKRPRRMALTPNGAELWVTNEMGASVTVLSTKDYAVAATIPLAIKGLRASDITPVGITMTRDGKTAFVAMGQANHVAVIDVASRAVKQTILVGKRPWNVHLTADEKRLWVVNGLSDDVTVIDVASGKALKSIPVGRVPYGAVITP